MKSSAQSHSVVEAITYSFIKNDVKWIRFFIPLHGVQTISLQCIASPQRIIKATDAFIPYLRKEKKD